MLVEVTCEGFIEKRRLFSKKWTERANDRWEVRDYGFRDYFSSKEEALEYVEQFKKDCSAKIKNENQKIVFRNEMIDVSKDYSLKEATRYLTPKYFKQYLNETGLDEMMVVINR